MGTSCTTALKFDQTRSFDAYVEILKHIRLLKHHESRGHLRVAPKLQSSCATGFRTIQNGLILFGQSSYVCVYVFLIRLWLNRIHYSVYVLAYNACLIVAPLMLFALSTCNNQNHFLCIHPTSTIGERNGITNYVTMKMNVNLRIIHSGFNMCPPVTHRNNVYLLGNKYKDHIIYNY